MFSCYNMCDKTLLGLTWPTRRIGPVQSHFSSDYEPAIKITRKINLIALCVCVVHTCESRRDI